MIRPQLPSLLLICLTALSIQSCGLSLFNIDVNLVGEKSVLEQQVLGTYADLGRDLTVYASVRAVEPDGSLSAPPQTTNSQTEALRAMSNRRYNRDDLDALLSNGVVGEGNDGLLSVLDESRIPSTGLAEDLARQVIQEENQDRTVIIERLIATTPGIDASNATEVPAILAGLNRDLAPSGSQIQNSAGQWSVK